MSMQILPAIDLKDGKCVRLRQGVAEDVTVYGDDPVEMALHWQQEGGDYLHVVDLDGAFQGAPAHTDVITRITAALDIPMEIGGGLRSDSHVEELLEAGVDRVILGTRAWSEPETLAALVARFGGAHIAVGIDARDGLVQIKGWVETTEKKAVDLAAEVDQAGVGTIIYTDTARDGMMGGPNLDQMAAICSAVSCNVIASGGVSSVQNVKDLGRIKESESERRHRRQSILRRNGERGGDESRRRGEDPDLMMLDVKETELKNGVRVISSQLPHGADARPWASGLALAAVMSRVSCPGSVHFIEHLLFKGNGNDVFSRSHAGD